MTRAPLRRHKTVTKCGAEQLNVTILASNQLSGYGYDAAGNMTHDATTNLNYTFDAENRITGAAGYTYTYDADGNRVEKSNGGTGTIYWYMTPGIVAESDLSGNLKSEYVFFDGERGARKDFSGNATFVAYYFSDHLKTASVITNSAGIITEDEDYYPWGGELQFVNSDSNHYKFTGKERDAEIQLDYFGARYYASWTGRFLSADWAEKPEAVPYSDLHDPQSLNLYAYVRNNPATHVDPDGHECHTDSKGNTKCRVWSTPLGPDGIDHATPSYAINRWIAQWNKRIDNFLGPTLKHFDNALSILNPCPVEGISLRRRFSCRRN